jgi:NADPH-dependent ferric siderophore reductase
MTAPAPASPPVGKRPGRIGKALIRLFMKPATIAAVEPIGTDYRLVTMESAAFMDLDWTPGQKVQIALGSAFLARTYTPVRWDGASGSTDILAYAHGDGPGSAWVRTVRAGDRCDVFGPRASLDLAGLVAPLWLFGDETAFGLAVAAARPGLHCVFEADMPHDARAVLDRIGLAHADLVARKGQDRHLDAIEARLAIAAAAGASFVLTGKAGSVQRLHRALKVLGVPAARIRTKAYWAPGKTGLD